MLFTQSIEEGVLQKLAFVGHDMFRVGWIKQGLTIAYATREAASYPYECGH
jgi:hypothetical protein